ncbi:MAG: VOC family protein [Muribaculaceae bacterium]
MEIKSKFDHFNFNVSDLDRSIKFYNDALNLTEQSRIVAKDGSFIIVYLTDRTTDFKLELTWLKDHPQKYDLGECEFHLCVRVENYEKIRKHHEEMGVVCYVNTDMGLYFIEDPDGYWIEVLELK